MAHTRPTRRAARSRRRLTGVIAAGAALALLAGYGVADAYDRVPGILTVAEPIHIEPVPKPEANAGEQQLASPLDTSAPVPADLAGRLDELFDDERMTGKLSIDIRDAATNDVLYTRGEASAKTPASVTKVLTGAAALLSLGGESRFTTTAALTSTDGPAQLHLIGGGDVLLGPGESDPMQVMGHAGLATLAEETAEQLKARGISSVQLSADVSRYTGPTYNDGWEPGDIGHGFITHISPLMTESGWTKLERGAPRHADPVQVAVDQFAEALAAHGIDAEVGEPAAAGDGAEQLAQVESAPVSAVVQNMMLASDNVSAEVLGREVALAAGKPGSGAEAPLAVIETLRSAGLDTGSIALEDVSGLNYGNRISAHDLTTLIQAAAASDGDLSRLIPGMPVGGLSGTLAERYEDPETTPAAGRVNAKTGTLRTVTSLAGTVLTADGRLLVFSLMADDLQPGTAGRGREVFDEAVTLLAECGCS
ncbi:D-alanyl-D-alanine carboxypeptidase/D-alanyl-D-alanine endopeptidase [Brevibacterium luteolum]|uniref:D-alanyl-D-alanine carboxypeptidase/D-alanyl-D-alanine endopeptidase n=1 Tax=Brevibacterium luteolum TaxID=199591 RepID=UPI003EEC2F5D